MVCEFCSLPQKYSGLVIQKFALWTIMLRSNQNYLGWCFVVLNRHQEDLFAVTQEEWIELRQISIKLRNSLQELFRPDRFNYASLGNKTNHVHLQIIPRYRDSRVFSGITFTDKNWGKNYSPWDDTFRIEEDILISIKKNIQNKLYINNE